MTELETVWVQCIEAANNLPPWGDLGQPRRTWQTIVASECPKLTRRRRNLADAGGGNHDRDNGTHDGRTGVALGSIVEDLDEWLACCTVENFIEVSNAEYKSRTHNQCHDTV